jgi:hypothetical protein
MTTTPTAPPTPTPTVPGPPTTTPQVVGVRSGSRLWLVAGILLVIAGVATFFLKPKVRGS